MEFKAAIFDMDGVVVDTVPIHFNAWKRMFAEYGHDFSFEEYKAKVDGIPRTDGAKAILTNLSDKELEQAAMKKQDYFKEELSEREIPTYVTTINLISELQKKDIKVAVISASKNAPDILKKIGLLEKLDAMVSGHDVTKGKPDPQVFQMAAKKLNVAASDAIVFEDAVLGVEAAKRGGFKCVGIDRYKEPERLAKADLIVSDLGEVNYQTIEELFGEQ